MGCERSLASTVSGSRTWSTESDNPDAMARALVRWSRVRRLDHPEGWVVRVATNLAIDATRRRRVLPTVLDPVNDPAEAAALVPNNKRIAAAFR